ncbi:MAG: type II secretion system F family protein [Deltaproteobacteria bacterium]|nr:type II secretion system F family protein [Deltaproteobacteria bacterium]MBW2051539.1 type II secretion system F family protein [Deltaproteobacteria bacterium]MBW2140104.1 type II secretion system F family protein [Deltaproteobacteria bacterium]MBW2322029.1 type II secretion system F family protein [Deltaproteobacteria bacterium]
MPYYVWKGVNTKGNKRKGKMEADSEKAVEAYLKRLRIAPTSIKPAPKDLFENIKFLQPKVTNKTIIIFTRNFSTMIDAGLTLVKCLEILSNQEDNPTFKKVLLDVKDNVVTGATLSEAFKKHPKHFDDLYCNLVAAGEEGGILDIIFQRLARHIEKAAKLRSKVKGAMMLPGIIFVVFIVVMVFMLYFVIPVFAEMFEGMGAQLPAPTQFLVSLSNFTKKNIIYIIVATAVFIFLFRRFKNTERGQVIWDRTILQVPIFGDLQRKMAVAHFTRTLSTMMSSGVPIMDGLEITAHTAGNKIIEESIIDTRQAISEGRVIADPLEESGVFPAMVIQMISVGEEAGALETMLAKIADFYDDEVDAAVEALTTAIEPLMTVIMGVGVGGLMIAMYMPMFQIGDLI